MSQPEYLKRLSEQADEQQKRTYWAVTTIAFVFLIIGMVIGYVLSL